MSGDILDGNLPGRAVVGVVPDWTILSLDSQS